MEKLNTEEPSQPEENLNYDELFSLSQAVITDQTSTDTEFSQTKSQSSQITPLKTPQNTKKISTSSKRKRGRQSSKSPTNNNNKSSSESESSSDKSISSISYKTPNNKNKKIILTETQSDPIKKRLRSYTKNNSLKSSSTLTLLPQSQSVTKPKTLYKPRNSSKPIDKTTLIKRNLTKKRKEIRYINTTPLPVNDLSQSSSQQEEEEEEKEIESEEIEVEEEQEKSEENEKEKVEQNEVEEEKDNNIVYNDEIIQNNKDNLLPQSPDTEPDSPIQQSIILPTEIIKKSHPCYKRLLDNNINILKPKPKRVKLTPVLSNDVVVDKKFSDNNYSNTSNDRINSSLKDIFGFF